MAGSVETGSEVRNQITVPETYEKEVIDMYHL